MVPCEVPSCTEGATSVIITAVKTHFFFGEKLFSWLKKKILTVSDLLLSWDNQAHNHHDAVIEWASPDYWDYQ